MPPTDREQRLQELANKNAWWASAELSLLETIREHKRKLIELPDIIRQLEAKREFFTAEMLRTGAEHDALEAESDDCPYPCDGCEAVLERGENCPSYVNAAIFRARADDAMRLKAWVDARADENAELEIEVDDAEFRTRANDMADDYADHLLAVQPPVGW